MIIPVTIQSSITPCGEFEETSLRALSLTEANLEDFVRKNIESIRAILNERSLLVIGQQVENTERGRSDLVAVDAEGNIVLIELKRDIEDIVTRREPFEFQAIRYAANYARITSQAQAVDVLFAPYIEKHRCEYTLSELTPTELATRELRRFLEENNAARTFNQRQRIVLIASSFDSQTLSACAWLAKNGIDIRCVTVMPFKHGNQFFLELDQIVPPKVLDEFFVDVAAPSRNQRTGISGQRRVVNTTLPKLPQLFEWGVLRSGDEVFVRNHPDERAVFIDATRVRYNGEEMSCYAFGKRITGWPSLSIYPYMVHVPTGKTLDELRQEKLVSIEEAVEHSIEDDSTVK